MDNSIMPDMVPVTIRTTLPEYQHCCLEKVLAGVLLTWEEFLQLFDIRPDPTEYIIRGNNGTKHDLSEKIGDYVSSFKRKLKAYPVTLESVNGTNNSNSQKLSLKAEKSKQRAKLKRLKSSEPRKSKVKDKTLVDPIKRGRKPKQTSQPLDETRRSSITSKNTKESVSDVESSESEDEAVPSKDNKKLLKDQVIKYLTDKVSPRSFMRVRNELIALRDQEKYFKVTSIVPMTAGMLEQSFCRKINQ